MARLSLPILAICFFLAVLSSALPTQQDSQNVPANPYSDFTSEAIKSATQMMQEMNDDTNDVSVSNKPNSSPYPAIPPMAHKPPHKAEQPQPEQVEKPVPHVAEPEHEIVAPQENQMPKPSSTPTIPKTTPSATPSPVSPSASASATPVAFPDPQPQSPIERLPIVGGIVGKLLPQAK